MRKDFREDYAHTLSAGEKPWRKDVRDQRARNHAKMKAKFANQPAEPRPEWSDEFRANHLEWRKKLHKLGKLTAPLGKYSDETPQERSERINALPQEAWAIPENTKRVQVKILKEFRIPGTNILIEAGDILEVNSDVDEFDEFETDLPEGFKMAQFAK